MLRQGSSTCVTNLVVTQAQALLVVNQAQALQVGLVHAVPGQQRQLLRDH
jgi:hypothetical protein